jgi:hypothetical protein
MKKRTPSTSRPASLLFFLGNKKPQLFSGAWGVAPLQLAMRVARESIDLIIAWKFSNYNILLDFIVYTIEHDIFQGVGGDDVMRC